MYCLFMRRSADFLLRSRNYAKRKSFLCSMNSTVSQSQIPLELQEICKVVSSSIGGLDDLESNLNGFQVHLTSTLVTQIMDACKNEAPTRRLLRFFLWSRKRSDFDTKDEDFNHAIRVLAEKKDHTAMQILISDLRKEGRVMEAHTFGMVAETLVKLGKEDEALGIFKNLDKFNLPQDSVTVSAIISALCAKGHAKKACGVVWHHKDKISSKVKPCVYRSLVYGWSMQENVKEARNVLKEMKGEGVMPDLFSYNTFLRGLCERNLKRNPSGLVPEALNVMMEMRSHRIEPNSITYNILLGCLQRARRVQESCRILERMKSSSCSPDWMSYYLVIKVLYLTGRFGKGNKLVDEMIENGLVPVRKFYYDLIGVLCGVERVNFALKLFECMKKSAMGGYGPVYDVLIPKVCKGGNFEKGKELWDEAMAMGVSLQCSVDVLDPSITEVFKPTRKVEEEVKLQNFIGNSAPRTQVQVDKTKSRTRLQVGKTKGKFDKKMISTKRKKKSTKP